MKKVLITGTSSGLGKAFAEQYLAEGAVVYGCSRRGVNIQHDQYRDAKIDLAQLNEVQSGLSSLLADEKVLDVLILNAGVLGEIQAMSELDLDALKCLMDINVWANKLILDFLLGDGKQLKQVVVISSGAAVNGNKGWGAYSLSKATINMLAKLYAAEFEDTHFISLAPGLVDTAMQDHLCDPQAVNGDVFPSVQKLRAARGTDNMPTPEVAAKKMIALLPRLKQEWASGEFVDIRSL